MRLIFASLFVLLLIGCSNPQFLEESIGVGPDDNAILCIKTVVPGRYTGTTVALTRLEFPAGFDTSSLTAEQLNNLERTLCGP